MTLKKKKENDVDRFIRAGIVVQRGLSEAGAILRQLLVIIVIPLLFCEFSQNYFSYNLMPQKRFELLEDGEIFDGDDSDGDGEFVDEEEISSYGFFKVFFLIKCIQFYSHIYIFYILYRKLLILIIAKIIFFSLFNYFSVEN